MIMSNWRWKVKRLQAEAAWRFFLFNPVTTAAKVLNTMGHAVKN